jgi:3-deoxy-D-manno-octulosonate 8-phosphate phosphatase (KDO 8-P phosphatase)
MKWITRKDIKVDRVACPWLIKRFVDPQALVALLRRAHEMKMEFIYMKQPVKVPAYEEILRNAGVSDSAVAFIGDDLPDIPLMRRAGLSIAVGDAVPEVKKSAHFITKAPAGHGAIREAVELILKSKGVWEAMIDKASA